MCDEQEPDQPAKVQYVPPFPEPDGYPVTHYEAPVVPGEQLPLPNPDAISPR